MSTYYKVLMKMTMTEYDMTIWLRSITTVTNTITLQKQNYKSVKSDGRLRQRHRAFNSRRVPALIFDQWHGIARRALPGSWPRHPSEWPWWCGAAHLFMCWTAVYEQQQRLVRRRWCRGPSRFQYSNNNITICHLTLVLQQLRFRVRCTSVWCTTFYVYASDRPHTHKAQLYCTPRRTRWS